MKIIQVTPRYFPDIGGVETHVKAISEVLVEKGFEVEVICTDPSGSYPKNENINGVEIRRFKSFAPNEAYYIAPRIHSYLKKAECDVIHAHNYHTLPAFFATLARKDRKFIFTPHTFGFPTTFPRNLFHKIYKIFGRYIFNSADKVITVSKTERLWLRDVFNIPEGKLIYIPLFVDIAKKIEQPAKDRIQKIAFVGRLSEEKNIDVLISAFTNIKVSHPDCELYIVGDGPMKKQLEKSAEGANDVNFLGALGHNEVVEFLDDIDLFVLPSKYEVLGISVLEAMSKQIPVIMTPVGELSHTLTPEENCLFTKIGDIKDLTMKITLILEDPKLRNKIAENGKHFVSERHDINGIINKYINIYSEKDV
ncbi:MAG: glycosyltransferase family 4 protein [Thermoplasmata archaeon]|nr:glycosyltransferase family 4 protein [Thermoplasmata archaeon]